MPRIRHTSLKNKILSEWQSTNKLFVIICTLLSLFAGIYCAVTSGGFSAYSVLCLPDGAPHVFFMPFLWVFGLMLLGLTVGSLISVKEKYCLFRKKRVLIYLFAIFALILLWPPVFFSAHFFLGVLIICSAAALTLFSLLELFSLRLIPSFSMLFFWVWLLFLLYLNLAVLFLN